MEKNHKLAAYHIQRASKVIIPGAMAIAIGVFATAGGRAESGFWLWVSAIIGVPLICYGFWHLKKAKSHF